VPQFKTVADFQKLPDATVSVFIMDQAQPVDQACAEMVQAIAAGQRELIMMSAASVRLE